MCGGGSAAADARETERRLRKEEADREARVREGQSNIDAAFSQFDDNYFDNYASRVTGSLRPTIEGDYERTRGKLVAALAGRGMLESTEGARETTRLETALADTLGRASDRGFDAARDLRGQVENQRGNLYSLNLASADPAAVSAQAIGAATSLVAPREVSPIEGAFSSFLTPYSLSQQARQYAPGPAPVNTARRPTGSGSGRLVR